MGKYPVRKNIRLKDYDYSQTGAYFITICTKNRENLFGNVIDGIMCLNEYGEIVENELNKTAEKRPYAHFANCVIMPNHVHILILLYQEQDTNERQNAGTARRAPTREQFGKPTKKSIPTIIRAFKSAATKGIREYVGTRRAVSAELTDVYDIWQIKYYDHIIRTDEDYIRIAEYIDTNPQTWENDCFFVL